MVPLALEPMPLDAYLRFEEIIEWKNQLFRGRIEKMAGGSLYHSEVYKTLNTLLDTRVRGGRCRHMSPEMKIRIPATGDVFYADGSIACPPNIVSRRNGMYDNPTVVFEVLSPGTEAFDRGAKFESYRTLESLRAYVLIHPEEVRVELYEAPDWTARVFTDEAGEVEIAAVSLSLPLADLYRDVRDYWTDED